MTTEAKIEKWIELNSDIKKHVNSREIQEIINKNLMCYQTFKSEIPNFLNSVANNNFVALVKVKLDLELDLQKGMCSCKY